MQRPCLFCGEVDLTVWVKLHDQALNRGMPLCSLLHAYQHQQQREIYAVLDAL
nr:hypothetical protein [Agarivorans sp. Alg241-V36]